jgi:hypothetical protein
MMNHAHLAGVAPAPSRQGRALRAEAPNSHPSTLTLASGAVASLRGDHRGDLVTCREGAVWLTQAGDARDRLLLPGDQFRVERRGSVVLEAMRAADVQVLRRR